MADQLHDLETAQGLLGGLGRTTLFKLMKTGGIASVRVGRRRMIPQSQIDAYIARNLESSSKPSAVGAEK